MSGIRKAMLKLCDRRSTLLVVGALVIIGVRPTYPSTGYGYIHVEPAPAESSEVETDPATGKVDVPGEVAIPGENTVPEGRPIPGEIPRQKKFQ